MNARFVDQLVGSPVLAKLILLACIVFLFLYLRRKDTEGHSSAFLALLGILVVRDFLSVCCLSPQLFLVSDIFHLSFMVFILLAPHDGSRLVLVLVIGLNVVAAAIAVGSVAFDLPVSLPTGILGFVLVFDICIAGLMSFTNRKDRSNSARHLVSLLWPVAVLFLLPYTLLANASGYDDTLFLSLVMPLSYGWLLAAALFSLGIQETELVTALGYYEEAIDSLYTMFLGNGSALEGDSPEQELLKRLNRSLVSGTGADGGLILLPDGEDSVAVKAYAGSFPTLLFLPDGLPQTAADINASMQQARFRFGEGILGEVAKTGKNVYCPLAEGDPRFALNGRDDSLRISSFMAVPLMIEDRILGVAALVRTARGSFFKEADFDRFKLLANFGSFTLSTLFLSKKSTEETMKSSEPGAQGLEDGMGVIKQSIQPRHLPRITGLSMDAMTIPSNASAGAYFDLIQARKDRIIGVVAEAGGKGLRAALVLVMLRSVLQVLGRTDKNMAAVLNWANRVLHSSIENDHAPSVGLVCLDVQTGGLEYSNAGRLSLFVYRQKTKTLDYISRASVPIGKGKAPDYERIRLQLQAGDMVVLCTDGVTGCLDDQGNQFGRKALARIIARNASLDATAVMSGLGNALSAFSGTAMQQTDQTVLVLKLA